MEEVQASSTEADQQNQIPPNDQAGTENRPIPTDSAQVQGSGANRLKPRPHGCWFQPEDSKLILTYLEPRIRGEQIPDEDIFRAVEFYEQEPQELTRIKHESCRDEWYFFTQRKRSASGKTLKRKTPGGKWRCFGGYEEIKHEGHLIGYKRSHQYYRERKVTEWLMKEYSSAVDPQPDTVICQVSRIKWKKVPLRIIPDLNRSPPTPGHKVKKKRRYADAPLPHPADDPPETAGV